MCIDPNRLSLGTQFAATVGLHSQRFFLLRVHRDRWAFTATASMNAGVNVFELDVTVGMVLPLTGLAIALK